MANMVTHTSYAKNQKQILIGQDSYYIALPVIVIVESSPIIISDTIIVLALDIDTIPTIIAAPVDPVITPHTSPITSQNIDDTLSLFLISINAVLASRIFLDAIALNGSVLTVDIATPTISQIIPINTIIKVITIPIISDTLDITVSAINVKNIASKNDNKNTVNIHL